MWTGNPFSAEPTGSMNHKYMQGVAIDQFAADIKNVTSRTHLFQGRDAKRVVVDHTKGKRTVQQGDINATLVRTVSHHILIPCIPQ